MDKVLNQPVGFGECNTLLYIDLTLGYDFQQIIEFTVSLLPINFRIKLELHLNIAPFKTYFNMINSFNHKFSLPLNSRSFTNKALIEISSS